METLKALRLEAICKYTPNADDTKADVIQKILHAHGRGEILVIEQPAFTIWADDDIIDELLHNIEPTDSGYVFFEYELDVDPINSPMVPRHRLATDKELAYLEDICVPRSKLPVIRMKDPIRRWHNFEPRSIIAIDRPAGESTKTYFRIVSNS